MLLLDFCKRKSEEVVQISISPCINRMASPVMLLVVIFAILVLVESYKVPRFCTAKKAIASILIASIGTNPVMADDLSLDLDTPPTRIIATTAAQSNDNIEEQRVKRKLELQKLNLKIESLDSSSITEDKDSIGGKLQR